MHTQGAPAGEAPPLRTQRRAFLSDPRPRDAPPTHRMLGMYHRLELLPSSVSPQDFQRGLQESYLGSPRQPSPSSASSGLGRWHSPEAEPWGRGGCSGGRNQAVRRAESGGSL
ncbi:hypothetical protein H8959_007568 [Pygathrix nigripes]